MDRLAEFEAKVESVRRAMREEGLPGVLFTGQAGFSWLSCGGENRVVTASERGAGGLLVGREGVWLLADNIEAGRLLAEELRDLPVEPVQWPWHEPEMEEAARRLCGGVSASDAGGAFPPLPSPVVELSWTLLPPEIERYRQVGAVAASAMDETCRAVERGWSEQEVAAELARGVLRRGAVPTVVLVAADERIRLYRHPLPTEKRVERCVMVVLCARRFGLVVSLTRLVHFGEPDEELRRRHRAVCNVDAAFILATRPGAAAGDVFAVGAAAYEKEGFPEEWRLHHQGGATGYAGRTWKATPGGQQRVQENQAFAWNPSIAGTKSEDTMICGAGGNEVISGIEGWPMLEASWGGRTIMRPDILVR